MIPVACLLRVVFSFGVAALLGSWAVPARAVTIDMVTVGNPGNTADTTTYGAVAYEYQIGKYEVTIQQYTDFLTAVAAADPYLLYSTSMASELNIAGISRAGSSGSYTYSVINNSGNRPITYVSWLAAARFANWMMNGQGAGSTETGAYTLGGQTSGTAPTKNPGATFYIPTENEWYKAAYYSPVLNSGSGGYYTYATQSNTVPGNNIGGGANQANYRRELVYSVTQSASYSSSQNYLTEVGAFTSSASYYGTFDQSGSVWEVNSLTGTAGSSVGLRGGSWGNDAFASSTSFRTTNDPSGFDSNIGFRLASPVAVPEPSTCAMALAGLACGSYSMLRRRRAR